MRSVVEVITRSAPAARRRRAMAKPMPSGLPAPVTSATWPFRESVEELSDGFLEDGGMAIDVRFRGDRGHQGHVVERGPQDPPIQCVQMHEPLEGVVDRRRRLTTGPWRPRQKDIFGPA